MTLEFSKNLAEAEQLSGQYIWLTFNINILAIFQKRRRYVV